MVSDLNSSIEDIAFNVLDGVIKKRLLLRQSPVLVQDPSSSEQDSKANDLFQYLLDSRLSSNTRETLIKYIVQDRIIMLVHRYYFEGGVFFGVESENLRDKLDAMFSTLAAGGKSVFGVIIVSNLSFSFTDNSDPFAIQRWRSMTVEAVFGMNNELKTQLRHELVEQLTHLLKNIFLSPNSNFDSFFDNFFHERRQAIMDIARQACKLSYSIQHDIVSCQMMVTVCPTGTTDGLGTYAFGLLRVRGTKNTTLMRTKSISPALFQF
jgi:hypothetical protein